MCVCVLGRNAPGPRSCGDPSRGERERERERKEGWEEVKRGPCVLDWGPDQFKQEDGNRFRQTCRLKHSRLTLAHRQVLTVPANVTPLFLFLFPFFFK